MLARLSAACAAAMLAAAAAAHGQSGFAVDLTWQGTGACFDSQSPPFSVSGVPAGTTVLLFAMKDLDAPNFPHGGGSVTYRGQSRIDRGAFAYRGPCPPNGQHSYQWTVEARDVAGKSLATATVTKRFPPD